ncbi:hypothetical protein BU15DRAFT_80738 [Melanogaster broomeanus]|nr:hypothetical protein BU15DRAFT_80738 [Melanogaster broomeanus]
MNCGTFDFNSLTNGNGLTNDADTFGRMLSSQDGDPFGHPLTSQDTDHFVRTAPLFSPLNQQSGYSQVTTERDTIKVMFDQMSTSLKCGSSPSPTVTKTAELYPNVRFWTQTKYTDWTRSPEAHCDPRWKVAFLEDEEGKTIPDDTIKAIRKKLRGGWAELVDKKVAPQTWGKANASSKELLQTLLYKAFPILQLSKNDWKLDYLCSMDYPGWARNNMDALGNWPASRGVKQEVSANADEELVPGASKKRKAKWCKSEATEKKFKGSDADFESLSPPPAAGCSPSAKSPLPDSAKNQLPSLAPTPAPSLSSQVPGPSTLPPPQPASSSAPTPPRSATQPRLLHMVAAATALPGNLEEVGSPAAVPAGTSVPSISTPSPPAASHEAEVSTSGSVVADNQSNLEENLPTSNTIAASSVIANPLAILSKNVLKLKIPLLPPIPINMTEEKKNNVSQRNKDEEPNTAPTASTTANAAKHQQAVSNRKMHPTKNKTGYNLCAWRWITQINENGTSEEFRDYWFKQLGENQCKACCNIYVLLPY